MTDAIKILQGECADLRKRLEAERARRSGSRTEKVIRLESLLCDRTTALMKTELSKRKRA